MVKLGHKNQSPESQSTDARVCQLQQKMTLSWQQVLYHKYQYQYQRSKYQYKYQYLTCKYKYKYQYPVQQDWYIVYIHVYRSRNDESQASHRGINKVICH